MIKEDEEGWREILEEEEEKEARRDKRRKMTRGRRATRIR